MAICNENNALDRGCSIQLDIFDLNQHGQGVGKHQGLVVFVDGAIPGERITAKIIAVKKKYALAVVENLVISSKVRVEPVCPLAERCGGCAVQHLAYSAQLEWKQKHIKSLLDNAAPTGWQQEKMLPIIGMDYPYYYRGKVQIPLAGDSLNPLAGFYERRSHQIVDGDICYIQHPAADLVRAEIRNHIKEYKIEPYKEQTHTGTIRHIIVRIGYFTGQIMVIIVCRDDNFTGIDILAKRLSRSIESLYTDNLINAEAVADKFSPKYRFKLASLWLNINDKKSNVVMGDHLKLMYGKEYLLENIMGIDYRISPQSFFQINPQQTIRLYREILRLAQLKGDETVLDLYCGTGSISLLLAASAAMVRGVEIVEEAIENAQKNAEINNIENVRFSAAAAEKWLPDYIAGGGRADLAVIDPPRKGCEIGLIKSLCSAEIPVIIYVSCKPATLARDLASFGTAYQVEVVQPVDMFPHSDSVECIVRLKHV